MATLNVTTLIDIMREVNPDLTVVETDADKTYKEIGLDSLDMASVFLNIEESCGIQIPDEDVENLKTINQILEYVNSRAK